MPNFTKKLLLLGVGLVVALAIGELLLRLLGFGVVTPAMSFGANTRDALEQGRFQADDDLFWALPTRADSYDLALNAVHPQRDVPAKKPGRRRLLVLGDSCSRLAVGGKPYSVVLQEALFRDGVEVLNASVPGYSSHQGLTWLRLQLLAAEPDLVVVYFGWNDHWRVTGMTDRDYAASRSPWSLRLAKLIGGGAGGSDLRVPSQEYRENLESMVEEIRAVGGEVILVAAPSRFTDEARRRLVETRYLLRDDDVVALHEQYLQVLRAFQGIEGVRVLAADHVFRHLGDAVPLLHRDGIHLTDVAHEVLGALLAEMISPTDQAPDLMGQARRALLKATGAGETR